MGWSTIKFRGNEFEPNDGVIEVWLLEVVQQIDMVPAPDPWLKELRDDWHLQAISGFGFGIVPQLDKRVTNETQQERMIELFKNALKNLEDRNDDFTVEELELSGAGGENLAWLRPLPKKMVLEVGLQFLSLLK